MHSTGLTDQEFKLFQTLIYSLAGISMADSKKQLVAGRLSRRLRHYGLDTFDAYYRLVTRPDQSVERQLMVDLLTTNETYFFREAAHFGVLAELAASRRGRSFRVWSGASSTGEEPYTIAMVLAETLGMSGNWKVMASDISLTVLERARAGVYPLDRGRGIPPALLKKYCTQSGQGLDASLEVVPQLRTRVEFRQINLIAPGHAAMGKFDMIFLRNVMIYFDQDTKRKVIGNLLPHLADDGIFIVGHSETLSGITTELTSLRPTLYTRPGAREQLAQFTNNARR
ncbi:CheR family methyltransferase [Thauera mechernichensis]|uniref:Chemotaxis protein methyltransferase n=1 Tax=Thauera mechernichensis TaxID=82788 RepID=A0ABW3WDE5_9RHOO|nr:MULTISPECIES: protein-glutamate O-methyltransferase CheR [Thauera]HAY11709.1 protein-glutamate O-methyltransferase CheR [Thauera sp.]ENO74461.1 chemotaxis protein methyltransferase [Thauera sp. 27]MDG3066167.1 protein-glutamate O-methyltransferase CheR [Thauera mechernichensis]WBL64440.1 protein-glutamate O-methyltransferase CheR [Thauera sp. WB-2]HNR62184.1 protein-glutamate O-methyltransferase CheR [Thauera sp.]